MKLRMTAYKSMAPAHAVRVDVNASSCALGTAFSKAVGDCSENEYFTMWAQLTAFIGESKGGDSFIYYWVD
jgi:hypothetical protein